MLFFKLGIKVGINLGKNDGILHKTYYKLLIEIYTMRYTRPAQFEPLLPAHKLDELYAIAHEIVKSAFGLKSALDKTTANTLAKLLRAMNSYYSNKIEGYSTHPINIESGLRKDFSSKPSIAKLQKLAVAHIEAEREIESWIQNNNDFSPFTTEGILRIHKALYRRLPEGFRKIEDGRVVLPGILRDGDVEISHHVPPTAESLPEFLARYEQVYASKSSWDKELVKIACAHHRLAWIHPFFDGNGRVARLASHAALYTDFTSGLWSVCRGLARTSREYYMQLSNADQPRHDDLDGKGHLSDKGLWNFCHYFLNVCLDQVNFMTKMLDANGMKNRIRAMLATYFEHDPRIKKEAELPLHYLFTSGYLMRSEFKQMTGLGDKVAQNLLSRLLAEGLVESDTKLGPVRFGLPLKALQFYFPDLYPEAATKPTE